MCKAKQTHTHTENRIDFFLSIDFDHVPQPQSLYSRLNWMRARVNEYSKAKDTHTHKYYRPLLDLSAMVCILLVEKKYDKNDEDNGKKSSLHKYLPLISWCFVQKQWPAATIYKLE